MTDAQALYDEDFVAWTEQQAAALRAAARGGTNQPLDWENLAEEIESLGRSDKREVRSQINRIVQHLATLQFSVAREPQHGWRQSIRDARLQAQLVLDDSPSLKAQLDQFVSEEGPKAVKRAIADLAEFGEIDRATERALLRTGYTADQVLGDWFPPESGGAGGGR